MNFVSKCPINKGGSNENAAYHGPTDLYVKKTDLFFAIELKDVVS